MTDPATVSIDPSTLEICGSGQIQPPCIYTRSADVTQVAVGTGWEPYIHFGLYVVAAIAALIILNMIFGPRYSVWLAHKEGEADLARARNEQQIQVAQAETRLQAAEANKKASIVEAEAVAAQITVIGDNVKEHPLYLTWQWIKMMEEREGATIYVPTEANLPILEAGRRLGVA